MSIADLFAVLFFFLLSRRPTDRLADDNDKSVLIPRLDLATGASCLINPTSVDGVRNYIRFVDN